MILSITEIIPKINRIKYPKFNEVYIEFKYNTVIMNEVAKIGDCA